MNSANSLQNNATPLSFQMHQLIKRLEKKRKEKALTRKKERNPN